MPTRPKRRVQPAASTPIVVKISEREGVRIARQILQIADPVGRIKVLKELEQILGTWATALANAPYVRLRSDLLARAKPLADRAESFWQAMRREGDVLTFAQFKGFLDFHELSKQLQGFDKLVSWINEEKSKRGGERRAFRKQTNDEWKEHVRRWFARRSRHIAKDERAKGEAQVVRIAQNAVERGLRQQKGVE